MFWCYYVAWPCDLLTLRVFRVQCFSCLTHIPIFIILRLSVTELRVLNIWSHFRYLKRSLRMRRVTCPLTGGKNSPHFWNPWPQFAYSLSHFHGSTTKIKPCYRQKIAFSYYEGYKVYCACAVSCDLCVGGPPKLHVTIFCYVWFWGTETPEPIATKFCMPGAVEDVTTRVVQKSQLHTAFSPQP